MHRSLRLKFPVISFLMFWIFLQPLPSSSPDLIPLTAENALRVQKIAAIEVESLAQVDDFEISKDGTTIAINSFNRDDHFEVWSLYPVPTLVKVIYTSSGEPVQAVRLSNTGRFSLAVHYTDINDPTHYRYEVIDNKTGKSVIDLLNIGAFEFSPDERTAAFVTASEVDLGSTTTVLWDLSQNREVKHYDEPLVHELSFSPDGLSLVMLQDDGEITIVDIASASLELTIEPYDRDIQNLFMKFISERYFTYIGIKSVFSTVYTWDMINYQKVYEKTIYGKVVFIPYNGKVFAVLEVNLPKQMQFFSLVNGELIGQVSIEDFRDISPDNTLVAGIDEHLTLYETATGTPLVEISACDEQQCSVLFNPDGRSLLVQYDQTIELWGVVKDQI